MDQDQEPVRVARASVVTELQRVTAIAQHQLNNPLAALLAESQLLASDPALGDEQREALDRMIAIVRRIIQLVHDLEESVQARDRG